MKLLSALLNLSILLAIDYPRRANFSACVGAFEKSKVNSMPTYSALVLNLFTAIEWRRFLLERVLLERVDGSSSARNGKCNRGVLKFMYVYVYI